MLDEDISVLKETGTLHQAGRIKVICCINLSPRGKEEKVSFRKCVTRDAPEKKLLARLHGLNVVDLMASCTYSNLVGGPCGPSTTNPANVECIAIGDCTKDIVSHLGYCKISDDCVDSEANLLLTRAGKILSCCNKQRSILP